MPTKAKSLKWWWVMCLSILLTCSAIRAEASVSGNVEGKILLQVEGKGEAWYVDPATGERYYLGTPEDAWKIMKQLSMGITDADLAEIPIAEDSTLPQGRNLENIVRKFFKGQKFAEEAKAAAPSDMSSEAPSGAKGEESAADIAGQAEAKPQKETQAKKTAKPAVKNLAADNISEIGLQTAASVTADLKTMAGEALNGLNLENLAAEFNIDINTVKPLVILVGVMSFILVVFGRHK